MGSRSEELEDLAAASSRVVDKPATLVEDLSFSRRGVVARIDLGEGRTAVAKRPFERSAFTSELEAFEVLPPDARPGLIGHADGVLVMEDLGRGPSLADLLLSTERRPAEQALSAWARTLGRAVGATLRPGRPTTPPDLRAGMAGLAALAGDLAVPVPAGVEEDVDCITATLALDSPWLAYCPGDTCPDNNRVLGDGSVRLFDFEGSGWRHAATEAAYCQAPFCTCWCVAALPAAVIGSMQDEFLRALDPPNRGEFQATIGLAAASWTLSGFEDYFRRFVHDGRPVGPPQRAPLDGRQYVVLRLDAMRSLDELPALAGLAGTVRDAILQRWPEAGHVPAYPAFRS